MNAIISRIKKYAKEKPGEVAYTVYDEASDGSGGFTADSLTWKQLDDYSDKLGEYIQAHTTTSAPIVVYGHKDKLMMVCFTACVKAGHAYCPVDISVPSTRVQDIIDTVEPEIVLSVADGGFSTSANCRTMSFHDIEAICENGDAVHMDGSSCLGPEAVFYIIFTSGSTGKPKGVQITTECLVNYVEWAQNLGKSNTSGNLTGGSCRFLNQAPFSFDLSVMDIYLSLYTGGTICAVTKNVQKDLKLLYKVLPETNVDVWVSTPSFADVCLSDRSFNEALLPSMKRFLFCGEILTNKTAARLREAFPESIVVNTYGPTESTVCVTEVVIDDNVLRQYSPLPVGAARPGTWLYITDKDGNSLPDGEQGEIVIVGDTVSTGYYKNIEQTKKAFSTRTVNGTEYRMYRTGDKGYIKDGQLFYCGRIDFQIKLHGYRIEIEDIENNLVKVPGVEKAVVLPKYKNNRVQSLAAYIVYNREVEDAFKTAQEIKAELKQYVPEYMIPKRILFRDALPMTVNGKVDRKALGGQEA